MDRQMPALVTIKPRKSERLFAVGDIHGCYDELLQLEKKITASCLRSKHKFARMISVGDLCDRGPATKEVLEHFTKGIAAGTHLSLLGNHEVFFILAFMGQRPDLVKEARVEYQWYHHVILEQFHFLTKKIQVWKRNGGASVFQSYGANIENPKSWFKVPLSHIKLLFSLPLAIQTPKACMTHALIAPGDLEILKSVDNSETDLHDPKVASAVMRILWEREDPESAPSKTLKHISGHTPLEKIRRDAKLRFIQIDTGAVYGLRLSAVDLEHFRALSVPSKFRCK